jgi:hypothetical protein
MAGRKKWSEIRAKAAPETLAVADAIRESYRLRGLREARGLTQIEVGEELEVRPAPRLAPSDARDAA